MSSIDSQGSPAVDELPDVEVRLAIAPDDLPAFLLATTPEAGRLVTSGPAFLPPFGGPPFEVAGIDKIDNLFTSYAAA